MLVPVLRRRPSRRSVPLDPAVGPHRLGGRPRVRLRPISELAIDALRTGQPVPDRAEPEPEPVHRSAKPCQACAGWRSRCSAWSSAAWPWRCCRRCAMRGPIPDRPPVPDWRQTACARSATACECPQIVKLPAAASPWAGPGSIARRSPTSARGSKSRGRPSRSAAPRSRSTNGTSACAPAAAARAQPDDSGFGQASGRWSTSTGTMPRLCRLAAAEHGQALPAADGGRVGICLPCRNDHALPVRREHRARGRQLWPQPGRARARSAAIRPIHGASTT